MTETVSKVTPFPPNCPLQVSQGTQLLELALGFEIDRQHPWTSPIRTGLSDNQQRKRIWAPSCGFPEGLSWQSLGLNNCERMKSQGQPLSTWLMKSVHSVSQSTCRSALLSIKLSGFLGLLKRERVRIFLAILQRPSCKDPRRIQELQRATVHWLPGDCANRMGKGCGRRRTAGETQKVRNQRNAVTTQIGCSHSTDWQNVHAY